jgi:hypothetical protein
LIDVQLSELYDGKSKFVVVGDAGKLFTATITITMKNNLDKLTTVVLVTIGILVTAVGFILLLLCLQAREKIDVLGACKPRKLTALEKEEEVNRKAINAALK